MASLQVVPSLLSFAKWKMESELVMNGAIFRLLRETEQTGEVCF